MLAQLRGAYIRSDVDECDLSEEMSTRDLVISAQVSPVLCSETLLHTIYVTQ